MDHGSLAPSAWVVRWAPLVAHGTVLDVACGGGRHARLFLQRKLNVVAVDREPARLERAAERLALGAQGTFWPRF